MKPIVKTKLILLIISLLARVNNGHHAELIIWFNLANLNLNLKWVLEAILGWAHLVYNQMYSQDIRNLVIFI